MVGGRCHLEDLVVDGRIILKYVFSNYGEEHNTEASGSMRDGEFLAQLSDCQLFKKSSSPWGYLIV
jgi:hypothetical protein